MGFTVERVVEGGRLSDLPHLLVWGGVGTRMNGDVPQLLTTVVKGIASTDWTDCGTADNKAMTQRHCRQRRALQNCSNTEQKLCLFGAAWQCRLECAMCLACHFNTQLDWI